MNDSLKNARKPPDLMEFLKTFEISNGLETLLFLFSDHTTMDGKLCLSSECFMKLE